MDPHLPHAHHFFVEQGLGTKSCSCGWRRMEPQHACLFPLLAVWSWSDPVSGMGVGHSVPKVFLFGVLCWWLALKLKSLLFAHGVKVLVHYSHLDQTPGLSLVSGSQNYHQETKRFMDALVTWCHLWGGEKKVETELQRPEWIVWFSWGGRGAKGGGEPWVVRSCDTYWIISKAALPQIWLVLRWHCKE